MHTMPLTKKGVEVKKAMVKEYGSEKGKKVFYASEAKGTIKGVSKDKTKGVKPAKEHMMRYEEKLPKGMMYTPDGMMKISDYEKRTSKTKPRY